MITFAAQTAGLGFLILLLSLPLAYRKVPMNAFYGIRIPASFQSPERWYDINAHGGRLTARWSVLIIAAGAVGFLLPPDVYAAYRWGAGGVLLVCLLTPLIQTVLWARQQPKG